MSPNEKAHHGASTLGKEPQTPDTRQSGVNTGVSRPSTGRPLSANVPAFVPTPTRSRFAGASNPAMPSVRELTAHEAAAEMRAWYAQEHPEEAYAATAGTRLPGTQYDNGLLQASGDAYMHLGYGFPPPPWYPPSQPNTGYHSAYADALARAGQINFPPSTPAQQMRTGPRGSTSSTSRHSSTPRQETYPDVYYHAYAPPQTPFHRPGETALPVDAYRNFQAVQGHTPSPSPAQHAPGVYASPVVPENLLSLNYAQWASSNSRQRAPVQFNASGEAVHSSTLAPRGAPSESPVQQAVPPMQQRAPTPYPQPSAPVHSSALAPRSVQSESPTRQAYPLVRQRVPIQHATPSAAVHSSAPAPRSVLSESSVRQAYPSDRRRVRAQHAASSVAVHSSALAPRGVQSGSPVRHAYQPIQQGAPTPYPPPGLPVPFPALAPRIAPSESPTRQAYSSDWQRAPTHHAASGMAVHSSALAPRGAPSESPVRHTYPPIQQRAPTPYLPPGLPVPSSALAPGGIPPTAFEQWASSTGQRRIRAQHSEADSTLPFSTLASEYIQPPAFAQQAYLTGRQRAPAQPAAADSIMHSSNFAPVTIPSSNYAPQAHSTGHRGTYPVVLRDPFIATTSSFAGNINNPRPAPPTYPGHESFTTDQVEGFIRKVQVEEWLRQARNDQMLAQQHASNLERQVVETAKPEQKATATDQSGTITEAAQRALEQRLADRIRRERVEERERAMRGIPDPQEAADRAQFQRIVETHNHQNYSREPVNPRLPNAHIVASDPEMQDLVSMFETAFSNMSLYRRGYAPFPGSLHSQTDQSSTGQAPIGQSSSRSGMGRITDSIPDWSDPAIRHNPEIRRDFLNNSVFVPFMGPAAQDGNRRMPKENPELPMSGSNTTSPSEGTTVTPMDTPSQSDYTPTESASDEGGTPQPTAPAVVTSEEEKTPRPSRAVPAPDEEKTPRASVRAVPVSEQEKTPRPSARVFPAPGQWKSPIPLAPAFFGTDEAMSPQPSERTIPAPVQWKSPIPLVPAVFGTTEEGMPPRRSVRRVRAASKSKQEKTPQPCDPTVSTSEQMMTPQPSASAVPTSEQEMTSPSPVPVAPASEEEKTSQLPTPAGPPDSEMAASIGLTGPALSSGSTVSPDATISTSVTDPTLITYAKILAGLARAPRPSSAAQDPDNTEDHRTEVTTLTYTGTEARRNSAGYPPYSGHGYGYIAQMPALQAPSTVYGGRGSREATTPARTTKRTRNYQPSRASRGSGHFNLPRVPTAQTTDSVLDQPDATEDVAPSQTENQAQDTPAEGTLHEPADAPIRKRRRKNKKRKRMETKPDAAALQQDLDAPNEGDNLPTEGQ